MKHFMESKWTPVSEEMGASPALTLKATIFGISSFYVAGFDHLTSFIVSRVYLGELFVALTDIESKPGII
jgi:hypothetical protein